MAFTMASLRIDRSIRNACSTSPPNRCGIQLDLNFSLRRVNLHLSIRQNTEQMSGRGRGDFEGKGHEELGVVVSAPELTNNAPLTPGLINIQ